MDRKVIDYLVRKMDSRRGRRRDYEDHRDYETHEDNRDNEDGRRSVRRRRDYEDERRRFSYEDGEEYGKEVRLTKSDMHEWKQMLENADGSRGPHYDMQQIMSAAEKSGVHFKEFSEAEFCTTVNMIYADYCQALRKFVEHDRLLDCCVYLAKAFLEDEDGPEASEKLARYYCFIVNA